MGIAERDYVRTARRPAGTGGGLGGAGGGLGGAAGWSATTWIIAICVAVFLVDKFLPGRFIEVGPPVPAQGIESIERPYKVDYTRLAREDPAIGSHGRALVRDPATDVVVGTIMLRKVHLIESWLYFSTQKLVFDLEIWRLLGFQFLHDQSMLAHILFNMVGLFFFGPMVEQYLGKKRYVAFYLLCGIFGALMYFALNLGGVIAAAAFGPGVEVPGLLFTDPRTQLVGASAGVFGVIMAGAYLHPNAQAVLWFLVPIRLRTLAYGLVAISVISLLLGSRNAGGEAAHLGGAIAGFFFIRRPHHLHDFFDVLGRVDPTSHHYRGGAPGGTRPTRPHRRDEIDRILDKVSASGLHSLTQQERRVLSEYSRNS